MLAAFACLLAACGGRAGLQGQRVSAATPAAEKPAASQSIATLLLPAALAYDSAGNLFFADARRHQVFELTLAGVWSVVAGTGEQGFAGDGGPASAAMLNGPRGLAVASDGTLYIADTGNQRIRVVSNGVISTLAGSGVRGYSGDGPAPAAALRDPSALALDAGGNLLFCDTGNQRVRKLSGGSIVTVAGSAVQGFGGEGAAATSAYLDSPLGVAVGSDGTVFIADTHNQRVRSVRVDGTIVTVAGTGAKGYAGDGGPATLAALDLPFGVAAAKDGSVLIADAGNQRVRSVSAAGVISTVAGTGVQGIATDATTGAAAFLNSPRAVSLQRQGQTVFADVRNGLVRELADDDAVYTLALLSAPRASSVTLSAGPSAVYGQGSANVSVSGTAATAQGTVALFDKGSAVASGELAAGQASLTLGQLGAGSHVLTAGYAGDGLNGSSSSSATPLVITAAPAIATANAAAALYGAPIPALSGTLAGVLPRDAATVQAVFSTTAGLLSPVGSYPINAGLSGQGSANYTLSMGAKSGLLLISAAPSATALSPVAQTYAGLSLLLSATVASTTSGLPSGAVDFLDGSGVVGSATLVQGAATASVVSLIGGAHTFSARYSGDANFLPSTSAVASVSVAAMPDFVLALASASQSVQGGSVATFTLNVSPQNGPFTGAVAFSVSGLPQGATAAFSPALVVPGASAASVTLSIQTVARTGALPNGQQGRVLMAVACLLPFWWLPMAPQRLRTFRVLGVLLLIVAAPILGCGTRTTGSSVSAGQVSTLTLRGTGTNLAGAAVSHTATANLTVF